MSAPLSPLGSGGTIRVFFGLSLSVEARSRVAALRDDLLQQIGHTVAIRAVGNHALHVTLKYLGNVSPRKLDALVPLLSSRLPACALDAKLCGVVQLGHGTVIALELRETTGELERLAKSFDEDTAELGYVRDGRGFRPHVTVARLKRPIDLQSQLDAVRVAAHAIRFDSLCLFASEADGNGRRYPEIARVPLFGSEQIETV